MSLLEMTLASASATVLIALLLALIVTSAQEKVVSSIAFEAYVVTPAAAAAEDKDDTSSLLSHPTCITESGIDFAHINFADVSKLKEESLENCVSYCLERHPDKNFVLVSLYNAVVWGDQFNCICSNEKAFVNTTAVAAHKCKIPCPGTKKYM
jgi:hypothetical protein